MNDSKIMIYGVLGVAGIIATYFLYKKVSGDIKGIFGSQSDEDRERNIEAVEKLKYNKKGKFSLGKDKVESLERAGAMAKVLYQNLKGVSDIKNYAVVNAIFKALKYKNDVRAVIKKFGVRGGETLEDWVLNENMPEKYKTYILTKIGLVL